MSFDVCPLDEIAEVVDSLHKTPSYVEHGHPMVRVTDVKYGELDLSKTLRVDDATFKEFSRRYTPSAGDIIITRVGTYGVFGKVVNPSFCLGQNTAAIIPKSISADYLYAVLNSDFVRSQIEAGVVGSTQKTLSLKAIKALQIPRMGASYEAEVASFSSALDDRIALLQATNATLEAIAQALFKSWFVDFDPVRAKMEGRTPEGMDEATAALFPDGFETSELGEVPRGWRIGELGDVAALKGGKQLSKEAFSNSAPNPVFGGAGVMGHTEQRNATDFVITVGRVGAYCGQFFWHIGDAWVNNNASHVLPSGKISSEWLLLWLKSVNMDVIKKGAAQPFVSNGDIAKLSMIHPPIELIGAFGALVAPMFARSQLLVQQSVELASVRDTLLPRLISGQLRLDENVGAINA